MKNIFIAGLLALGLAPMVGMAAGYKFVAGGGAPSDKWTVTFDSCGSGAQTINNFNKANSANTPLDGGGKGMGKCTITVRDEFGKKKGTFTKNTQSSDPENCPATGWSDLGSSTVYSHVVLTMTWQKTYMKTDAACYPK
jgi:hypothetical protein